MSNEIKQLCEIYAQEPQSLRAAPMTVQQLAKKILELLCKQDSYSGSDSAHNESEDVWPHSNS